MASGMAPGTCEKAARWARRTVSYCDALHTSAPLHHGRDLVRTPTPGAAEVQNRLDARLHLGGLRRQFIQPARGNGDRPRGVRDDEVACRDLHAEDFDG